MLEPECETEPGTAVVPCLTRKVEAESVARFISSPNVAETTTLGATPLAASAGLVAITAGGIVSEGVSPPLLPPQPVARSEASRRPNAGRRAGRMLLSHGSRRIPRLTARHGTTCPRGAYVGIAPTPAFEPALAALTERVA